MFRKLTPRPLTLGVMVATIVVLVAFSNAEAAQQCKRVHGEFVLTPLTGPACTSSVGICATGVYRGGIEGESLFIASSVIQTVDTPTTSVILVTGDNTISSPDGDVFTKDAITLQTTGDGAFAEVDVLVGGIGEWLGATGTLTATGTFSATEGGSGRYEGEVCRA